MSSAKSSGLIQVKNLHGAEDAAVEQVSGFATMSPDQVGPGKKVSLYFELKLENGELIDSCFEKAPATFVIGDGSMLPGFEHALFGLRTGETLDCELPPEQAFGNYNTDNIQSFPRYRFPADLLLSQGLMIDFSDSAGNTQAGMVKTFDSSTVEIDFNHPLAERRIGFRAQITAVEAADIYSAPDSQSGRAAS